MENRLLLLEIIGGNGEVAMVIKGLDVIST
jgi:hypothetical protein